MENWPKDVIAGRDALLERAVQEAMRLLKEQPGDRATKQPPTWEKRKEPLPAAAASPRSPK